MTLNAAMPGTHRCRKCGARWSCAQQGCRENATLLCLQCDFALSSAALTGARKAVSAAREKSLPELVKIARDRLWHVENKHANLEKAMLNTYGTLEL